MEQLLEILSEIQPDVDYETCTTLIDDEWLILCNSVNRYELKRHLILGLRRQILCRRISSAQALYQMVKRLQEEG